MIKTPTIPVLANPVLMDRALYEIQQKIVLGLSWIDHAFGEAQTMTKRKGNRQIYYPGVFAGSQTKDYLNVLPDRHLGCYSFFHVKDPIEVKSGKFSWMKADIRLVFWYNLKDIYGDNWVNKTNQHVLDLVDKFFRANRFVYSDIEWDTAVFDSDKIYSDYSDDEIKRQHLMRPYGGFALEGSITIKPDCGVGTAYLSVVTPPGFADFGVVTDPNDIAYLLGHNTAGEPKKIDPDNLPSGGGGGINYSLSEQDSGVLDIGGKSIYQRTWYFATPPTGTSELTGLTHDYVDRVVYAVQSFIQISNGTLNFVSSQLSEGATSADNYTINTNVNFSDYYVTVSYTKA